MFYRLFTIGLPVCKYLSFSTPEKKKNKFIRLQISRVQKDLILYGYSKEIVQETVIMQVSLSLSLSLSHLFTKNIK